MPQDQDTGGFFIAVLTLDDVNANNIDANAASRSVSSGQALHTMKQLGYNPKLNQSSEEITNIDNENATTYKQLQENVESAFISVFNEEKLENAYKLVSIF